MRQAPAVLAAILAASLPAQIFPPPPAPTGHAVTTAKARLGQALFWDEQLSTTRSTACGSCHIVSHGGADPRGVNAVNPGPDGQYGTPDDNHGSPGVPSNQGNGAYSLHPAFGYRPQVTRRMAPSMINAGYTAELFWDGRARSGQFRDPITNAVILNSGAQLENLIAAPPLDVIEMGHPGRNWSDVVQRVQNSLPLALASSLPAALQTFVGSNTYAQLFQQAFGTPGVDASRIIMAIATYIRTLVSDRSPVDRFLAGQGTLTPQQQIGLGAFIRHCVACHNNVDSSALFSGPIGLEFRNTGVRPIAEDRGRSAVTSLPADDGKFKVPDLRNVALRGPFFRNGSQTTLGGVVDFYNRGGDFHVNQDPLVPVIVNQITAADRAGLIAFLQALTDPRVAAEQAPFDRPRLFSEGPHRNRVFGSGTPGTGGLHPRAIAEEPALLGAPHVTVAVDRAVTGQLAALVWDLATAPAPQTVIGLRVELALSPATIILGAGTTQGPAGAGKGVGSFTFAVPATPQLSGLVLYGQWLLGDPQGPGGFTTSDAFSLQVR